jgi:hypothetical protein
LSTIEPRVQIALNISIDRLQTMVLNSSTLHQSGK